ncbi:MAG TPA: TonB-dependent receptor, partial [Steroidobacteraceae bacterium]
QTLQLGGIFYHNTFGAGSEGLTLDNTVQSTTATAQYHWVPTGNPWADLHAQGSYTNTRLAEFTPGFFGITEALADLTHYDLDTYGVELDNTTRLPLGPVSLALNYGAEYYRDEETTTDETGNAGTTPGGRRSVASGFAQATLGWNIVQVIGAVRYDSYSLTGSGNNQTGGITGLPAGPYSIDKSTGAASPKITLTVNPLAPWMLYASYGLGFRPPALTETLMEGAHPGLGFLRFVPNPDLDPERTHGWEAGSKLAYTNLLAAADTLSFKVDYFRTNISHYIDQTLVPSDQLDFSGGFPIPIDGYYFVNLDGTTVTKGFELEGEYDARWLFARLAYSNILTELGTPDYTGFGQIVTAPPRSVFSGTAGVRLLGGRLILGERTRAVSRTTGAASDETGVATTVAGYVIEDLFASYQATPHFKLFASVDNLGNREYLDDALATTASPGRTFKVGFTAALGR